MTWLSIVLPILSGVLVACAIFALWLRRWGPLVVAVAMVVPTAAVLVEVNTPRPIAGPPPDMGAPACVPVPVPQIERGELLATDSPMYAGEPIAEGCTPAAGWEATQCHTATGRP